MTESDEPDADRPDERRRRLLAYAGLAALGGVGVAGAWTASRGNEPPDAATTPDGTATPETGPETDADPNADVPERVRRYAPDLYFGALEKWFPTDPRPYVVETNGRREVDGFAALDGYSAAFAESGSPPAPVAFYNVVEAAPGVDAIQYWFYSAFDQFTVNFHWHDWELLQVFLDRETGAPLLVSASAHARGTPNNEFLDPDVSDGRRLGVLSEVGSHSSASEVNHVVPSFERLPTDDWVSDVTNDAIEVTEGIGAPFAYGLPRGEGARLPFVMPELDGHRLDEHPDLDVERSDFVDERVTVGDWRGLPRPPAEILLRGPGLVLAPPDSPTDADATYALEPLDAVREEVDGFVGPQLSFEFAVPGFVEDRLASHITSVGIPWEQERYADPLADVTDPAHRRRIDGAEPAGLRNRVVGRVRQLRAGAEGALDGTLGSGSDALGDAATVSLFALPVEAAVRLASEDPEAAVTRGGVFGSLHVEPGDHLLTVNAPGIAPLAQGFVHEGGTVRAGADGDLTVVANEDAGWIRGDGRDASGIETVRVVEDYAGVVYEGRPTEPDRFAVAVHREGRYTVEVVDADGRPGAYRVTPGTFGDGTEAVRERVETGKGPLAATLREEVAAVRDLARELAAGDDSGDGEDDDADRETTRENTVLNRLSRAAEEATAAADAAAEGDAATADERLATVRGLLEEAREALWSDQQEIYDTDEIMALEPRLLTVLERVETALETGI
ncbi:hypothetical protein [Haloparvum sedimenti]|uniref:hypothetical protein n=1 Tax=Haloparvum sedimenti TaxID=1678448 RepID=UPI00071E749F|nr:hypothetical protein [Haloparvum sedimenti]